MMIDSDSAEARCDNAPDEQVGKDESAPSAADQETNSARLTSGRTPVAEHEGKVAWKAPALIERTCDGFPQTMALRSLAPAAASGGEPARCAGGNPEQARQPSRGELRWLSLLLLRAKRKRRASG
jgi:hypothetical protein